MLPQGLGESIIIGVAAAGKEIATRPFQLVTGQSGAVLRLAVLSGAATCRKLLIGIWKEKNKYRRSDYAYVQSGRKSIRALM